MGMGTGLQEHPDYTGMPFAGCVMKGRAFAVILPVRELWVCL
jgi:hypothetical protein